MYYEGDNKITTDQDQISHFKAKRRNLSEYVKEIKQGFSRVYSQRHHYKAFFDCLRNASNIPKSVSADIIILSSS